MVIFWLILVFILSIIEVATINLVTIWFVVSAIVSLIMSFLGISFQLQFLNFVLGGIVLLFLTRKKLVKILEGQKHKTNLDRILDMDGIVTADITKSKPGEVKIDGKYWRAFSSDDIMKGSFVRIKKIEGTKLIVEERK